MAATMSPIATAVMRSSTTVSTMVMPMIIRCSRCTRCMRLRNRQSTMSQPTFSKMPASAASGTDST